MKLDEGEMNDIVKDKSIYFKIFNEKVYQSYKTRISLSEAMLVCQKKAIKIMFPFSLVISLSY